MNRKEDGLTPSEIVASLDKHIVGQKRAKRLVAIALRNRWRRLCLEPAIAEEVLPKHILMIGPTGCGKTEIARRLAQLVRAPFVKVEATKFTEVGYVGRDVTSIVRDLVAVATDMVRNEFISQKQEESLKAAKVRLVSELVGSGSSVETRREYLSKLEKGELDEKIIEINLKETKSKGIAMDIPGINAIDLSEMLNQATGGPQAKKRSLSVKDALIALRKEEEEKRIDSSQVSEIAIKRVESRGIVFLDEMDKILENKEGAVTRGGISREGVQRDLLPLIEGTVVRTNQGTVDTKHILFIAAGAFHLARPNDLIPELQGRLPVRVELDPLTESDLLRVLTEPKHSLIKQYQKLLEVEGLKVKFDKDALAEMAKFAFKLNQGSGNVGARRLFTVMETLLEDLLFEAHTLSGKEITISKSEVKNRLKALEEKGKDVLSIL